MNLCLLIADLSRNRLQEVPLECTELVALERLVLHHNIIRAIPDSIASLQSLQFLDLR
jgi:Leucine-rich repeat (LRR) protein